MTTSPTSLGAISIEAAKPEDLSTVIEIIDAAAAWLHSKGITRQWLSPAPKKFQEFIEKEIAKGEVYLARLADGSAIGTLRFEWHDADLWCNDPAGGGYVHSFATHPRVRGHQIGAAMLTWAKEHVRARGRRYLRLDCWGGNQPLCDYYTRLGFAFCGFVREGDWADALFQIDAGA